MLNNYIYWNIGKYDQDFSTSLIKLHSRLKKAFLWVSPANLDGMHKKYYWSRLGGGCKTAYPYKISKDVSSKGLF